MPPENDAARFKDWFDELARAGIDPRQFAAFVSQFIGSTPPSPGAGDNVPGFEYVQRVSTAAFHAVLAHGEEANRAWSETRRGRFGIGAAMQSWTKVVENYAGVVAEGLRFPAQTSQPGWQFIPYSKKNPPTPPFSVRTDSTRELRQGLEYTTFAPLVPTGSSTKSVRYSKTPEVVGGRIEFTLDRSQIQTLDSNTDYIGFIYRKGMGAAPPVAIIVVHVTD
jgi:hypothetical protein